MCVCVGVCVSVCVCLCLCLCVYVCVSLVENSGSRVYRGTGCFCYSKLDFERELCLPLRDRARSSAGSKGPACAIALGSMRPVAVLTAWFLYILNRCCQNTTGKDRKGLRLENGGRIDRIVLLASRNVDSCEREAHG